MDTIYNDQSSSQDYQDPPSNQLSNEKNPTAAANNKPDTYKGKPLDDVLSQFTPFDTHNNLNQPFKEEIARDETFIQEQAIALMGSMLETWAWNIARIRNKTETEGARLSGKLKSTLEIEKEQGMSDSLIVSEPARSFCADFFGVMCKRLEEFVIRMRSAIEGLRGL